LQFVSSNSVYILNLEKTLKILFHHPINKKKMLSHIASELNKKEEKIMQKSILKHIHAEMTSNSRHERLIYYLST